MATGRRHPLHSASTIQLQRNVSAKAPLTDASFLGVKRWAVLNTQSGSLAPGAYRHRTAVGELRCAHCGADTAAAAVVPRMPTLLQTGGGAAGISFTSVRFAHTSTGPGPPQCSHGAPMRAAVELGAGSRNVRLRACAHHLLGAFPGVLRNGLLRAIIDPHTVRPSARRTPWRSPCQSLERMC